MNNINEAMKNMSESINNFIKNNRANSLKLYGDLKKQQLKQFSTKELIKELKARGINMPKKYK